MTGVSPVTMDDLTMYNSNMVLYFVDNYIRSGGQLPKKMFEDNIRVDYNKLRMTEIYKDMKHSYIVELKYAKGKDTDDVVSRLREEAIVQANRYAETEVVKRNIGHTQFHKIVVVYKGMEMVVCEELN